MPDLKNPPELREAITRALESIKTDSSRSSWLHELAGFLRWTKKATRAERASVSFQQRIWNDSPVSAVGQGNINVDGCIQSDEFREFVASLWEQSLPAERDARTKHIHALFELCLKKFEGKASRLPWLKALRVFAAAFPHDFTTVAHRRRLYEVEMALTGTRSANVVECSRAILEAISGSTPDPNGSDELIATRMMVPWILYEDHIQQRANDATTEEVSSRGDSTLVPRPAVTRRRGLTAFGGYLSTLKAVLEFVREGREREDLREHIRSLSPTLKSSSINTLINALMAEWDALKVIDGKMLLTGRAAAFLDTGDPGEFSDWLLTRVLGVDNTLFFLRDNGTANREALIDLLRNVNPGWTSDFAPTAMLRWLEELSLVERGETFFRLTDDGKRWAMQITWTPETLPRAAKGANIALTDSSDVHSTLRTPELSRILEMMSSRGKFISDTVAELHLGVWAPKIRHFAVLAGLSGSGKTLLARAYGEALALREGDPKSYVLTVPVQPGWYDPVPLLGYVNPVDSESYHRTPFLNFLLAASQDAARTYTVVLDEMNLSHPEQYLAPLLSVMETGESIALHRIGEDLDGVPSSIRYPSNLVLIGTVNMDETTHALSDKVLDRAHVMEFWDVDVDGCPAWANSTLTASEVNQIKVVFKKLTASLRPVRLHFGWRLIEDALSFIGAARESKAFDTNDALDRVVYAKLLPKIRGDDTPRMREALGSTLEHLKAEGLGRSSHKLAEMFDDLMRLGSVRYWR